KAPQIVPSFVQSSKKVKSPRHYVQHVETSIPVATPKPASPKPASSGKRRNRKALFMCKSVDHFIRDCDYHAKKMAQPRPRNHAHRASAAVPRIKVTQPRHVKPIVTKTNSSIIRYITRSPSLKTSNSSPRVTIVKAPVGNPQHALKDKGVIGSGCSRHMTGNMSYLSDFEELNGGYVAFGGNPKGGKIFEKGKIKTDSLLPIPFWAETVNTASYVQNRVLVTKPYNKTPYELLHGRTPSIGFMRPFCCPVTILNTLDSLGSGPTWFFDIGSVTRTMNYQPITTGSQTNPSAGFQDKFDAEKAGEEIDQQYVLFLVWSFGSTNPQNNDGDAAFDGKEHDFDAKKPESEVSVSPSSSAQSKKQDDNTKKEARGKSHVESFTGYRVLSVEFEDFSNNSINELNATGTIVPTVGQNSSNSTNTVSAAGPSNAAASPTYGKYSFIDASQPLDDPDMPELEDITYSDDEDDVGTEADFNNLETSITVSPIPTTRVHKDHPISQIIGDLSSTTQTRSMTRVVKDQCGLSQMFNDDFHTSDERQVPDEFIWELTFFLGLQKIYNWRMSIPLMRIDLLAMQEA
nr:retrovirus-related Pol polyprotein from transposon TNT 1-94 [Tanacetum cinerariifolium]